MVVIVDGGNIAVAAVAGSDVEKTWGRLWLVEVLPLVVWTAWEGGMDAGVSDRNVRSVASAHDCDRVGSGACSALAVGKTWEKEEKDKCQNRFAHHTGKYTDKSAGRAALLAGKNVFTVSVALPGADCGGGSGSGDGGICLRLLCRQTGMGDQKARAAFLCRQRMFLAVGNDCHGIAALRKIGQTCISEKMKNRNRRSV